MLHVFTPCSWVDYRAHSDIRHQSRQMYYQVSDCLELQLAFFLKNFIAFIDELLGYNLSCFELMWLLEFLKENIYWRFARLGIGSQPHTHCHPFLIQFCQSLNGIISNLWWLLMVRKFFHFMLFFCCPWKIWCNTACMQSINCKYCCWKHFQFKHVSY